MSEITLAFIKNGDTFKPSHLSEIKKGDIYYLVADGKPTTNKFTANEDACSDIHGNWDISGTPILGVNK
jgi:hypothetical protein